LTQDPEELVREHAAWALGEIGRGSVTAKPPEPHGVHGAIAAALQRAANEDESAAVRAEALAATQRLSEPTTV
jgi:HEAT repeat protein